MNIINTIKKRLIIRLAKRIQSLEAVVAEQTLPQFATSLNNVTICPPRRIINPSRIFLGHNIHFGPGSFLNALSHYPNPKIKGLKPDIKIQTFDSKIVIGNNVTATADLQIAAQKEVVIEDDVIFASNIHINDGFHGFETTDVAYKYQPIIRISPIRIKRGSWIGQNVVVMPGVTIGEFSIIGANSVVTKSTPSKCIAFGNPARVVKKWDKTHRAWIPFNEV